MAQWSVTVVIPMGTLITCIFFATSPITAIGIVAVIMHPFTVVNSGLVNKLAK